MQSLHEADPATVPHTLPEEYDLMHLIADLPLRLVRYMDTPDLYCAVLQVCGGCCRPVWCTLCDPQGRWLLLSMLNEPSTQQRAVVQTSTHHCHGHLSRKAS